jgi:hypothetical protein
MKHWNLRGLTTWWALLLLVPASAAAQPAFNGQMGRGCRDDLYFVDVPLSLAKPWSSLRIPNAVRTSLQGLARARKATWFCPSDGGACAPPDPVVTLESVLPQRADAGRTDGHLRYLRYRFSQPDGSPMPVDLDARCDVVATLQSLFLARGVDPATRLNIGRECEAQGQTPEGLASPDMTLWHMDRMGLPMSYAAPPPAAAAAYPVDIALIDSGVDAAIAEAAGIEVDFTTPPGAPGDVVPHRHGSAMALLLRQAAPEARIRSYIALDPNNTSTVGDVAWALDRALYDPARDPNVPLVINMSLGWPAEFGYRAQLLGYVRDGVRSPGGVTCNLVEDAAGESVRYLLERARVADNNPAPVSVFAAAGNRTRPTDTGTAVDPSAHPRKDPCATSYVAPGGDLFFPAAWALRKSCKVTAAGTTTPVALAVAVGGVDDRGLDSVVTMTDQEVALVAPGEHVYAALGGEPPPGLTPTSIFPWCDPASPPPDETFGTTEITLPMAVSGTSAAAALASGMAARALRLHAEVSAARVASGKSKLVALDHKRLQRLLYVTGLETGRTTPWGTNLLQRQIRGDRLAQALKCNKVPQLMTCLAGAEPLGVIETTTGTKCFAVMNACGLADATAPAWSAVDWAMEPLICSIHAPAPESVEECADAAVCPQPGGIDAYTLGGLGPQPPDPFCPECKLTMTRLDLAPQRGDFVANLNKVLPAGTYATDPVLTLTAPDGRVFNVSLASLAGSTAWTPGATLSFPSLATGTATTVGLTRSQWLGVKGKLTVSKRVPGKLPATDVSPVRIIVP